MKAARGQAGVLAECITALVRRDEDTDPVDEQAGAFVIAETILMWRKSVTKR